MPRRTVLLKLGGSLITDKTRPDTSRRATIRRLAHDIAAVAGARGGTRLLIGHGSGSFGHAAAAAGGLVPGADATRSLDAIATTQRRAAELHHLVMSAIARTGARAFSFAPSSFLKAANGRITGAFVDPIFEALDRGLLPVVYGDVVLDRTRGAVVVSTEDIFLLLVKAAAKRKHPIARAVWLGETDGVKDDDGVTIPRLSAEAARRAARRARGASGVDVTGGMALRLRTACQLVKAGVPSLIVDGRRPDALVSAIAGRQTGGTLVDLR